MIKESRIKQLGKLLDNEEDLSNLDFSKEKIEYILNNVLGESHERISMRFQKKLKEHLNSITKEEFLENWNKIKRDHQFEGLTAQEYLL